MKKIFFIIVLLGMTMTTFAKSVKETSQAIETTKEAVSTFHQDVKQAASTIHQDVKDITTTLYGDGKDAITSLYPDIRSAVVAIGKAIGVAAEHVYTVLVKKFVVDAIVQLLPFLLGLTLLIIGWYKISSYLKKEYVTQEGKIKWNFLYPLALVIAGIIALCNVDYNTMVMGLVNPEYGALNYILEYSKQMIQ